MRHFDGIEKAEIKAIAFRIVWLCVLTFTLMAWAFTVHLPQYFWYLG